MRAPTAATRSGSNVTVPVTLTTGVSPRALRNGELELRARGERGRVADPLAVHVRDVARRLGEGRRALAQQQEGADARGDDERDDDGDDAGVSAARGRRRI